MGNDDVAHVADRLRVLLNTRRGGSASSPGFGIIPFADYAYDVRQGSARLASSVRLAIESFEPALRDVTVHAIASPGGRAALEIELEIAGRLATRPETVTFQAVFYPGGKAHVSR